MTPPNRPNHSNRPTQPARPTPATRPAPPSALPAAAATAGLAAAPPTAGTAAAQPGTTAGLPDLAQLRTLVAVVDAGGFTTAARQLGVSVSVASRRLSALEAMLGQPLLHRSTRGMALTEAGRRFVDSSRALLASLEDACDAMRADGRAGGRIGGRVRLTAPQSLGAALLAPVLARLLAEHPALDAEVLLDDRRIDLVGAAVDLAVRAGPLPENRLLARQLTVVHGLLAASPDYLARHGHPRRVADLSRHVLLTHSELGARGLWNLGDELDAGLHQRVHANSFDMLHALALAGAGIAPLPPFQGLADLAAGRLVRVLPRISTPGVPLWAVAPSGRTMPARVRCVLDALVAYAARPAERWGEPA